jgi:VCBS repeat-containing protein
VSDGHGGTVSQDVTITIAGTNDQPTIVGTSTTPSGGVIEDANVNPVGDITASGTIGFNDIDLIDTHTAGFAVKSSTSTVHLPGFIDNATYIGTFALTPVSENNSDTNTTGSLGWTFTLDNDDPILQSLAVGQTITQVYTITVFDGHGGTTTQDVTITVTGSNDNPNHAPVIIGELTTATGEVVEDTDVNASLEIAADGTIVFRDVDLIDLHTAAFVETSSTSNAPLPGFVDDTTYIGEFALADVDEDNTDTNNIGSVDWIFTLDDNDPILQSLAEGETITQVYTVTVSDGHTGGTVTQDVTVTITGTEDAPTIESALTTATGGVTEDTDVNASLEITTDGTITFQDLDLIDTHSADYEKASSTSNAPLPGFIDDTTYIGTFALAPVSEDLTGTNNIGSLGWTFTLDNKDPILQSLADGETITQVYTVTVSDGHTGGTVTQDVTVTITGTNDVPTITSDAQAAEIEETANGHNSTVPHTASGAVIFTDLDLIDSHAVTITGVSIDGATAGLADYATVRGWLSLDTFVDSTNGVPGSQAWSFSAEDLNFDYLAYGQSVTLTYTIEVDDHHNGGVVSQDVVITIEGNDEPPLPALDLNGDASGFNNVVGYSHDDNTPVLIAADAQITDPDSQNLVSMTITLTNAPDNAAGSGGINIKETLSLTAAAALLADQADLTVTLFTPANSGEPTTLTITGSADLVTYQSILAGVQYTDTKTGHHDTGDRNITVVVNDGVLDSEIYTITVVNTSALPHGPVIGTDQFTLTENGEGTTTVNGLYVTDSSANELTDTYTITAEVPGPSLHHGSVTPDEITDTLEDVNSALLTTGVTYNPGTNPPTIETVRFTVADQHEHSDVVNFIFHQGEAASPVALVGTAEKDVIFATGHNDTLTGGAKSDQFVFQPEDTASADTITDFNTAEDRIDLRSFTTIQSMDDITVAHQGTNDTLVTLDTGDTILLQNVAAVNAGNFIFHHSVLVA